MTDLTEMWQELARYQPYADKRGFGEAWKRMTTERTARAARVAAWVAAEAAARVAARVAARAAASAAASAAGAAWVQLAIDCIRKAIEQEQT